MARSLRSLRGGANFKTSNNFVHKISQKVLLVSGGAFPMRLLDQTDRVEMKSFTICLEHFVKSVVIYNDCKLTSHFN